MSQPAIGYLDPVFVEMMGGLKSLLRYVYQTKNALTFPLSGPGSVGMEYCFVNIVAPSDKVIVCQNGVFGGGCSRMRSASVATRWCRGQVGRAGRSAEARGRTEEEQGCEGRRLRARGNLHRCQSDAKVLTQIAHKHGALVIVDAVTSLAGSPVKVDEWEIDAIYSASQKCLSCTPGLSPVSFNDRVVEHVKKRKDKIRTGSWT